MSLWARAVSYAVGYLTFLWKGWLFKFRIKIFFVVVEESENYIFQEDIIPCGYIRCYGTGGRINFRSAYLI